jgi:ribose 5-phosphate isomerase B
MAEKIPIGSDHAGYAMKEEIVGYLKELGYEPEDMGTLGPQHVDYPDFAALVASLVSRGERKRGILICGTGIGMSITANKFPNVRASLVMNQEMARLARTHNDANILALGGRVLDRGKVQALVKIWLQTEFKGGRHARRVGKITEIEGRKGCES